MGVSQNWGPLIGSPYSKDHIMLGLYEASDFWKLPYAAESTGKPPLCWRNGPSTPCHPHRNSAWKLTGLSNYLQLGL